MYNKNIYIYNIGVKGARIERASEGNKLQSFYQNKVSRDIFITQTNNSPS